MPARALCTIHLAVAKKNLGDLDGARSGFAEAIKDAVEAGEVLLYADCHHNLASLLNRAGNIREAYASFEIAAAISKTAGDSNHEFLALLGMAFCSARSGLAFDFSGLAQRRKVIHERLPLRDHGLYAEYRGLTHSLEGNGLAALKCYRQALLLARKVSATSNAREVHRLLAEFWVNKRHMGRVRNHIDAASRRTGERDFSEDCMALARLDHECSWLAGKIEDAIDGLLTHAQRVSSLGFGYEHLLTARRIAVIAAEDGRMELAREWWTKTEFLAETCGAQPLLERWRKELSSIAGLFDGGRSPEQEANHGDSNAAEADEFPFNLPPVDLSAHGIITRCNRLKESAAFIGRVATTTLPVLLRGESGTGKELFARLVHDLSPRKDGPFLAVNCAALPGEIIESELYGHRRGAFTGAINDKPGLFLLAHEGTLFLDEIGEMSPLLQAKLLRTLETGELRRVGDTRTEIVDVRLVAATNVDLSAAVEKGDFRRDLYFRLRGLEIFLPALRERLEDVEPLARHFVKSANRRLGRDVTLPDATAQWLATHRWPGNVRELRFTIEQAVALAPSPGELRPQHFLMTRQPNAGADTLPDEMDAIERARLLNALETSNWNQTEAAKKVGMGRTTLIGRMKRLGIQKPRRA